jgi:hypothetical protein
MLVANKKRKENIVEYILYLYQIENLIRAFNMDIELIKIRLIPSYQVDDKTKTEIIDWYSNLVSMMEKEGIQKEGHLQFLKNLIADVNEFHIKLLAAESDNLYPQIFHSVAGLLNELKEKSSNEKNDIEICLDTIYGFLLLKMQNKKITTQTEDAVKRLSSWMSALSKLYKDYESGELDF